MHFCLFLDWRRTVSSKFFDIQAPSASTEELMLHRHARTVLSRLRCNGHRLLLSSYLSIIDRIENPSCSECKHPSQDTLHSILSCPTTKFLRRAFIDCFFIPTSAPSFRKLRGFWSFMIFRHAPEEGVG